MWWGALESSHAGANHRSVSRPITAHLVKVHTAALRLGVPDLAVGEGAARAGAAGVHLACGWETGNAIVS